jgi:hypothetical protein
MAVDVEHLDDSPKRDPNHVIEGKDEPAFQERLATVRVSEEPRFAPGAPAFHQGTDSGSQTVRSELSAPPAVLGGAGV